MAEIRNSFTDEQINILKVNPYVAIVDRNRVCFTVKFKEYFWALYTKENMMPSEILRSAGIDPKMLGNARTRGMVANLKKEMAKHGSFTDVIVIRTRLLEAQSSAKQEESIERLRTEVEYLRQEREFLKKIISAEKGREKK